MALTPTERPHGSRWAAWLPTGINLPLGIFGILSSLLAVKVYAYYYGVIQIDYPELSALFSPAALPPSLFFLVVVCALAGLAFMAAFIVGMLVRSPLALRALRGGYMTAYVWLTLYAYAVFTVTGLIEDSDVKMLAGMPIDAVKIFYLRCQFLWLPVCLAAAAMVLHILSLKRAVSNVYTGATETGPASGDNIIENVRTHGRDPAYRKSTFSSLWTHLMILVIIPILLRMVGCVDPYRPPFGGGEPVVTQVKVVQREQIKQKQMILSPNSAIIFRAPELDDSKLMEEMEYDSKLTYEADPNAAHGRLGDGKAKTAGWQDGFRDGIMRFIRMEYSCQGWDDGMDSRTRADMNFLDQFREISGGMKTARHSESHPIRHLARYPKGQAPPFVFMTGSGPFNISSSDARIMREFLMEGSLLFADCGGVRWHSSFMQFARQLFPGNPLVVIPDDDPIFQIPFAFPNGAPPFWHHGGKKAMGIKVKNRWVVFYHPGDVHDAWKTGHSGMDPGLARRAYQLGVNIVYYSMMRYFDATREYRK